MNTNIATITPSLAQTLLHWLGFILSITTALLASADYLFTISEINPNLAHAWPIFLCVTQAIDRMAKIFTRALGGTVATLAIYFLCGLLFYGCTQTKLFSPRTGKPLLSIQSNATKIHYVGGGVTFDVDSLNNSTPTGAAYRGLNRLTGTVVSGATAILLPGSGMPSALERATVVTVPHFTAPKTDQ